LFIQEHTASITKLERRIYVCTF